MKIMTSVGTNEIPIITITPDPTITPTEFTTHHSG